MRVSFLAASDDGSSWYRCTMPSMALGWRGHRTWTSTYLPPSVAVFSDVVIGSRVASTTATKAWRRMSRDGMPLVLDMDDDYFHLQPEHRAAWKAWHTDGMLDRLAENLAVADRVTCVSEPLADVLRAYNPDVRVVPNGLHASLLAAPRTYAHGRIRIGWSGSASSVTEVPLAARALNRIVDYTAGGRAQVDVAFLGATPEGLGDAGIHPHPRVRTVTWIHDNDLYLRAVMGYDIWVAPYRDIPFTRAKFATKALEAGMLGIPLIVSDIAPYRAWITDGVEGFLVPEDQPHLWGKYLKMLVDDPGLRETMGRAARVKASGYVLQDVGKHWEAACAF